MVVRCRVAAALLGLVAVVLTAAPAAAAGTGGLELAPDPAAADPGDPVARFEVEVPSRGEVSEAFVLRNVTDEPRTARLYTAEVREVDGNLQVGAEGSSPWARLASEEVTLGPGEMRTGSFTVEGGELPDGGAMAAVVLEVGDEGVVQRAATMVYLDVGRQVPLPLLLVGVAVALVAVSAATWGHHVRRHA